MGGTLSSIGQAFDPTSSGFNPLRAGADVATFGSAELANQALGGSIFNNQRPLGLGPLGDVGATAAGAYFGGPIAGALTGSLLGGLGGGPGGPIGGGLMGGAMGSAFGGGLGNAGSGGLGGLLGSLIGRGGTGGPLGMGIDPGRLALGGSLLGLGLSQNTGVPNIQLPSNAADQAAIQAEEQRLKGMQGQSQTDLMNMLTTGPQGEAFREKYNNLGLLDSGAFNAGLAGQFAEQNYAQNQALQNLDVSGLSRQFGLEDLGTQANLATTLANAQQKADLQRTLLGLSGQVFGGGMGGGGYGGGGGGTVGGGGGGLFGGIGSALGSLGSGVSNLISSMMGGGGSLPGGSSAVQPLTGDPTLDLYAGGNPFANPSFGMLPSDVTGGVLQPW